MLAERDRVERSGIRTRTFHEPDYAPLSGDAPGHFTAFATEAIGSGSRHVFSELPPVRFKRGVVR